MGEVALCGEPSWKWGDGGQAIAWNLDGEILPDSIECWFDTYVKWLYEFWDTLDTFRFIKGVSECRHLAIVHPMVGIRTETVDPISLQTIKERVQSVELCVHNGY